MRGRYAPLPSRYSRPLRKLVDSMLAVNPSERPSFAQILRMPFIKKHICNLIRDIAARCVGLRGLRWGALVVTKVSVAATPSAMAPWFSRRASWPLQGCQCWGWTPRPKPRGS